MDFLVIYIGIGALVSLAFSEIDKWEVIGEEKDQLTNVERCIYIILWPVMLISCLYYLGKYLK